MKAFKVFYSLLGLLISMPLYYVLWYLVLQRVQATSVMWLLFWIYMPAGVLVGVCGKIAEAAGDK